MFAEGDLFQSIFITSIIGSVVTFVIFLAYYYVKVVAPRHKVLAKIPLHFPNYPIVGSALHLKDGPEFREQLHEFCLDPANQKHGLVVIYVGWHPIVPIWKAEYVEALLGGHEIKKSYLYKFVEPWLGKGLLTSHGDQWYHHRKLLTPSFHFRILNDFVPVMNERAEQMCQQFEAFCGTGKDVDIFPLVIMATLDVICEAAMGQSTGEEDRRARHEVFEAIIEFSHIAQQRQKKPQYWPDAVFAVTPLGISSRRVLNTIHSYTDRIFKERNGSFDRKAVEALMTTDEGVGSGKRKPLPFLDSLLYSCDNFTKLSERDIKDEVNTFLFTGHDTTAASTAFTMWLLACHPEAQRKVQEELDSIFGSSMRPITVEDIREMRYLTACLKESLRLYPVAPLYARELVNDIKFGQYTVPAGCSIIVLNEILHRDPKYFEDPLAFKPERFLVQPGQDADADEVPGGKLHPYAYVPFSAGQRNCIGQRYAQLEDKIMLASVFRRFTLQSDRTEKDLCPAIEVILRPTKGMHCKFSYR